MKPTPAPNPSNPFAHPLTVGEVCLRNRVLLAPMSGISDLPFRKIAWRFGAGMVVSEMVASAAFVTGKAEMLLKAASGDLPVHMVQLAGWEAHWMARAAMVAEANGADIIDINMGCPARRVTTCYSGSALMRDLDHALTLIDAVVDAVKVPVTLKMRLGWDENSLNADELAARAEASGIQMITVHGRTRCQFYKGTADWQAVANVKAATKLPVVVNGDIVDRKSATLAMAASGADALMIGRGSYGVPWLPALLAGRIDTARAGQLRSSPDCVLEHYELMLEFYGIEYGLRQARKHISWYLDRLKLPGCATRLRRTVLTTGDPGVVTAGLKQLFAMHDPQRFACAA